MRDLIRRITAFVAHHNRTSPPFAWTATANSILANLTRRANAIAGTQP